MIILEKSKNFINIKYRIPYKILNYNEHPINKINRKFISITYDDADWNIMPERRKCVDIYGKLMKKS